MVALTVCSIYWVMQDFYHHEFWTLEPGHCRSEVRANLGVGGIGEGLPLDSWSWILLQGPPLTTSIGIPHS